MTSQNKDMVFLATAGVGVLFAAYSALRRRQTYDLRGKTVLIAGGSRGLGFLLAREFAREGARVALCARDEDTLTRAQDELGAQGVLTFAIPCDVTDRKQVGTLVGAVRARFQRIDVLVNNAGTITVGPLEVMTLEDYEEAMRLHFWAPLYTTLAVLPYMRQRGEGRIVNIASVGGKLSVPHLLPYCASKFALVGLSEGLRAELAKDGILVTTVCPGLMRTGSPRHATFKSQYKAEYAWFSIGDALPLLSMDAERAARQIVTACKRGDAEVVLSLPAWLAVLFHGVFPGLTADALGIINRLLPGPGGIGVSRAKGSESASRVSPSWLTALGDRAAERNNQTN
ncbi:MAG TPA: SDR family NAD(P)-dependent oxidoreductase [Candidatus Binatia bacterium]|nr:SDR family NAD(P)-dependent oxidoreductase [Candidatus Binatia bacterium]